MPAWSWAARCAHAPTVSSVSSSTLSRSAGRPGRGSRRRDLATVRWRARQRRRPRRRWPRSSSSPRVDSRGSSPVPLPRGRERTRTAAGGGEPLRLLALISAFEWSHVDYLHALAERFELTVGHLSERHEGAVACAQGEGLRVRTAGDSDGEPDPARLAELIAAVQPDAIHALYYKHEELVLRARELAAGAVL